MREIDRIEKIRKILGDEYNLVALKGLEEVKYWVLYKKYRDPKMYFSEDNKAIMASDNNSLDELYDFAKKHHKINEHIILNLVNVVIALITLVLIVVNAAFIKSELLRGVFLGVDLSMWINVVVGYVIYKKNQRVDYLETIEYTKRDW